MPSPRELNDREGSMNKTVFDEERGGKRLQVDQLLDTHDPIVFHAYIDDESVWGDFTSIEEAVQYMESLEDY